MSRKHKKEEDLFNIDFSSSGIFGQQQEDPNKLSKLELVNLLSKTLSTKEISSVLTQLGKLNLANNFLSELNLINKKYDALLSNSTSSTKMSENKLLEEFVGEIITYVKRDFYMTVLPKLKPKNESDFSKLSLPFLVGALSSIKTSFERFGLNVNVEKEKIIGERERIDLLISMGDLRIGVELKYRPSHMSEFDHLMAQIDRYQPYLDYLIIISYTPIQPWLVEKIRNKGTLTGTPIKIVTPTQVV